MISDNDVEKSPPNAVQSFIMGGVSAAQNSLKPHRTSILSDVAHVLGCHVDALRFLIEPSQDDNAVFDFPDSERRRTIRRDNHLNIAE